MSRYYYNLIASMVKAEPSNPLWNDLLAYYTADNTPNDALGTYNGTLVNGATYRTGIINQGFDLDGVNDYVDLGNDNFKLTGDWSISFWVYFDTFSGAWVLNFGNYGVGKGILYYVTSSRLIVIIQNAGNSFVGNGVGNPTLSTGQWYHSVLTHKESTRYDLYLNGVSVDSISTGRNPDYPSPCPCVIGCGGALSNFTNGAIDEIGIWNRELTASEVTELYNSGAGLQY